MLSSFCRRGLLVAALGLSAWSVQPASAQEEGSADEPAWLETKRMPEGWEASPWETFARDYEIFDAHFRKGMNRGDSFDEQHVADVLERGWALLQDEDIVLRGDWEAVQGLTVRVLRKAHRYADGRAERVKSLIDARLAVEGPVTEDFEELENRLVLLKVLGGDDVTALRAKARADWHEIGDLSQIPHDKRFIHLGMTGEPAVDLDSRSARFTGTITIPRDGQYWFNRFASDPSYADWARVSVGGSTVLDTRLDEDGEAVFVDSVELSAGEHTFVAEFVRDISAGEFSSDQPEYVLMWKWADSQVLSMVPSEAFLSNSGNGLAAEFFGNPGFEGQPSLSKRVPSLQYDLAGPDYKYDDAVGRLTAFTFSDDAVAGWGQPGAFTKNGRSFARRMRMLGVEDRQVFLRNLMDSYPQLIAQIGAESLPHILGKCALMTDDTAARFASAWLSSRERFSTRPGIASGKEEGSYRFLNAPRLTADTAISLLAVHRWDQVEIIQNNDLVDSEGGV